MEAVPRTDRYRRGGSARSTSPLDFADVETIRDAIPDGTPCDDGDPCTIDDDYQEGVCSGTALSYTECTAPTCAASENGSGEPSDGGGT